MKRTTTSWCGFGRLLVTTMTLLALTLGAAAVHEGARAQQQAPARRPQPDFSYVTVAPQAVWSRSSESSQVPQDVRIMQRIVRTALSEVEAPELPEILQPDAGSDEPQTGRVVSYSGDAPAAIWLSGSGRRGFSVGNADVTGFYMQGYGYLFTVEWQVRRRGGMFTVEDAEIRVAELEMLAAQARRSAAEREADEARAAGEAERTLEEERRRVEEQQAAWEEWSDAYRERLALTLQGVVAQYGTTLTRATPDESITFIADFGGGDEETVTLSARRGDLAGAGLEENLSAVNLSVGGPGVSDRLSTELRIMEEIIDSSLQTSASDDVLVAYTLRDVSYRGGSSYQFVPGYGVLFRKSARLNLASNIVAQLAAPRADQDAAVTTLRQRINESTEEQTAAYAEHLTNLKEATAQIFATYGPTLTQLGDDDWVGIFYNVGSAAGLLEGGMTDYLVQARMADIRAAAGNAEVLGEQLVTNEKQD